MNIVVKMNQILLLEVKLAIIKLSRFCIYKPRDILEMVKLAKEAKSIWLGGEENKEEAIEEEKDAT